MIFNVKLLKKMIRKNGIDWIQNSDGIGLEVFHKKYFTVFHLLIIKERPKNTPSPFYEILIIFSLVYFIWNSPLQLGTKEYSVASETKSDKS